MRHPHEKSEIRTQRKCGYILDRNVITFELP
jgi:hypothetical protein